MGRLAKYILVMALFLTNVMNAQVGPISESVAVHTNSAVFICGETIYYKLYCRNVNEPTAHLSKLAYVELVGSDQKSVFVHKLFLDNGVGSGDFFIPAGLPSGNYKLLGYTRSMLNGPTTSLFQKDITIYNTFRTDRAAVATQGTGNKVISGKPSGNSIQIQTNKKTFDAREKVSLTVKALNADAASGRYSMSVRRKDQLTESYPNWSAAAAPSPNSTQSANAILPELRGEIISGKVTIKQGGQPAAEISVALSAPGEFFAFKIAKTDKDGKFTLSLDKPIYYNDIFVQVIGNDRANYSVVIDDRLTPIYSELTFKPFSYDPSYEKSLKERSVAVQIQNAFYGKKADTIVPQPITNLFFEPGAKEYKLDDYTRFPTFKETLIEVATDISFTRKDSVYTLSVTNYSPGRAITEPCLVLVDGLLVQNLKALFDYPAANINKISLVPGIYLYGPKAFNGVISVITKNQDFKIAAADSVYQPVVIRPITQKKYYIQSHSDSEQDKRIPDYRHQLSWIPNITFANPTNASFFASDITGTFEILIEGFTANGNRVSATETIEVK